MSYTPKFLSQKEFETFVSTVEAFIRTNDNDAISPQQVAQNMDALFIKVDNPQLERLHQLFKALQLYSQATRFKQFKNLPILERQKILLEIQNPKFFLRLIVGSITKDIIRGLKVLCTIGYYSNPKAKEQVGYVPFDNRASTIGKNQTLNTYNPAIT